MRFIKIFFILFFAAVLSVGNVVLAQVVIGEIMYDLPDADTGREWIEIANTGGSAVAIGTSTWKFFEANTNHAVIFVQGTAALPPGGFAVIADDPAKFLIDWPAFSGSLFDSSFSLSNSGETIALKADGAVVDEVSYTSSVGAAGDGNSLQKIGGVWKPSSPTPGWASPNQAAAVAERDQSAVGSNSSASSTPEPATISDPVNRSSWPVEPQIFSRIHGPAIAVVGADTSFRGDAVGFDKRPMENARFLWNFGDGSTKEGENVLHVYNFPGEYAVILDVSSGRFESSSRLKVQAVPADIVIGAVSSGADGKIELVNNSKQELDLSWWRIRSGGKFFTLPKNTKILPQGKLPISAAVMGFAVLDSDAALVYPNGSLVHMFQKTEPALASRSSVSLPPASESPKGGGLPAIAPAKPSFPPPAKVSVSAGSDLSVTEMASAAKSINVGSATPAAIGGGGKSKVSLWLYGLLGIVVLGIAFVLMPKANQEKGELSLRKDKADEFTVLE